MKLPEEWIQVWFSDNGTVCIRDTEEHRQLLDQCLHAQVTGLVQLDCLDGAPMRLRQVYIMGYIRSSAATRVVAREFQKQRERESKTEEWEP